MGGVLLERLQGGAHDARATLGARLELVLLAGTGGVVDDAAVRAENAMVPVAEDAELGAAPHSDLRHGLCRVGCYGGVGVAWVVVQGRGWRDDGGVAIRDRRLPVSLCERLSPSHSTRVSQASATVNCSRTGSGVCRDKDDACVV